MREYLEYLARAVNKATGANTAPSVMPNRLPVFAPTESEAESASLDATGGVIFRYASHSVGAPSATAETPGRASDPGFSTTIPAARGVVASLVESPGRAGDLGLSTTIQSNFHHAVEAPNPSPVRGLPAFSTPHPSQHLSVVEYSVDAVAKASHSVGISPHPVSSAFSLPGISAGDTRWATDARRFPNENRVVQIIAPPSGDGRRELPGEMQVSPRQPANREALHVANEETVVQVRIGRVEVRMAAPAPTPTPPPARPKGPRGFAEYESVRRYIRRN
jgi:hypothetical protein